MKKMLIAGLLVMSASTLMANKVRFTPKANYWTVYWMESKTYWTDGSTGKALNRFGTNSTDEVFLQDPGVNVYQGTLLTSAGDSVSTMYNFGVDSITASDRWNLMHGGSWDEGNATGNLNYPYGIRYWFSVGKLDQFDGYLMSKAARFGFSFPNQSGTLRTVKSLGINARPVVEITTAGSPVCITNLFHAGALEKVGDGELIVGGTPGMDATRFYVRGGQLTLPGGASDNVISGILAKAALHLDPTDTASLQTYTRSGKTYVTNWFDVRRNGAHAWLPGAETIINPGSSQVKEPNPPRLLTKGSKNGLTMLDFQTCSYDKAKYASDYGTINNVLVFERLMNVRDIFYVATYHRPPYLNPVLGDYKSGEQNSGYPTLQPCYALLGGSANWGARTGAIFADGVKVGGNYWPDSGYGMTNDTVYSLGSISNLVLSTIASDRMIAEYTGGMLVGEIILFTNELSRAERTLVNAYLNARWHQQDGMIEADAGTVFLQGDEVSIGVGEGQQSRVAAIVADSGTIVKTGAGTLETDMVSPSNAVFNIRGGDLKICRFMPATVNSPAQNPTIWLDASVAGSRPVVGGVIPTWTDCRGGSGAIAATANTSGAQPKLASGVSPSGLDAIELPYTTGYYKFPWWGDATARFCAGFVVMRRTPANSTAISVFGSKNMTFMCEDSSEGTARLHHRMISSTYPHPNLASALWTYNGEPRDPIRYQADMGETNDFFVVAFCANDKVLLDAIGTLRNDMYCGGMQIGEFLVYDRPLTEKERRDTEAYLMDKWMNRSHPESKPLVPGYEFASGIDPVVDVEDNLTVSAIGGGTGKVIKRGSGEVTVLGAVNTGDDPWKAISVESGALTVSIANCFLDQALMHFDVSDESTLVYTSGVFSAIKDVRNNGITAEVYHNSHSKVPPSLDTITTATGVQRKMLNFDGFASTKAALAINRCFTNVREAHVVVRGNEKHFMPLTWSEISPYVTSSASHIDYYRDGSLQVVASQSSSACVRNGGIWINGVERAYNYKIDPLTAMLMSYAPTEDTYINTIQGDRTLNGSAAVGEEIAFDRNLTSRERNYLMALLMHKWFAVGDEPVWTNCTLQAVEVAAGSTLTFTGEDTVVHAQQLGGCGSVNASGVCNVSTLTSVAADLAQGAFLNVSGRVAFADYVTVKISGFGNQLPPGDYTVLYAAGGLENVDLARWSCDMSAFTQSCTYKLVREGNKIKLKVGNSGVSIFFH